MARNNVISQAYPRIEDENDKFRGFLDEKKLRQHRRKIGLPILRTIIKDAIQNANKKSSRTILKITEGTSEEEIKQKCVKEGKELFKYFLRYCGDPASTAHACFGRHYSIVGKEQFRNRLLQKQRMNSGWRYQYIAKGAASYSRRFMSVSDINSQEADFNATVRITETGEPLNIYVSVKNRTNTMGGQDWPKAIRAMETVAKSDRNRNGVYICVFGIAMEKGLRTIKYEHKTRQPYSFNTEIWLSDFFWQFFSNYTYQEIINAVLSVLIDSCDKDELEIEPPKEMLVSFGECCRSKGLLDENGQFMDAYILANLFCGKTEKLDGK